MLILLFQCLLVVLMTIGINSFGNIRKGYVTLDNLLSSSNLGYNLLYRILSPAIFIVLVTIILFWLKLPFLTKDIWLISLYYFLFNFLILILLNRFALINKGIYILIVIFGIGISYWVYHSALQYGLDAILPDADNFRTDWWFIVLIYFYNLLNDFTPNYTIEDQRKSRFLSKRYDAFTKKYDLLLMPEFRQDNLLRLIFYSIMITEDINRPPVARIAERILFFTKKIKTTGIMQVTSKRYLSDVQSINLAQKLILNSYKKNKSLTSYDYELVSKVANDYNRGGYGWEISQNYSYLKRLSD